MLHLEIRLHLISRPFLDRERLLFQRVQRAGRTQVDRDIRPAFDLERERLDDAEAGVGWVREGIAGAYAEGGFPTVEGVVILIWGVFVRGIGYWEGRM